METFSHLEFPLFKWLCPVSSWHKNQSGHESQCEPQFLSWESGVHTNPLNRRRHLWASHCPSNSCLTRTSCTNILLVFAEMCVQDPPKVAYATFKALAYKNGTILNCECKRGFRRIKQLVYVVCLENSWSNNCQCTKHCKCPFGNLSGKGTTGDRVKLPLTWTNR